MEQTIAPVAPEVTGAPIVTGARTPRPENAETIQRDARWQTRGLINGVLYSLAVVMLVVLTAIDTQSGRILDREGHGWSFSVLFGPDIFGGMNLQGWRVVSDPTQLADGQARYEALLRAHLVVDFVFIAVYTFVLRSLIAMICRNGWVQAGYRAVAVLVAADLTENVLAWPGVLDDPAPAVLVATAAKWAALLAVVAIMVLSAVTSRPGADEVTVRQSLRRGWKAVMHQRFSFVPVVALFILSVPSGAAILEQLPDVIRRWISDGPTGTLHAILAMTSTLGLATFLIIAGRYRTGHAFRNPKRAPGERSEVSGGSALPYQRVWFVGPAVAAAGAVVALITGREEDILWGRLALFLLVPTLVILVGSWLIRRAWTRHPSWYRPNVRPSFDDSDLSAVRLAGNVAGLGAVVVGGLSLIRAFVPLVVLPQSASGADPRLVWMFLVIGLSATIAPWLIMIFANRRFAAERIRKLEQGHPLQLRSRREISVPWGSWILLGCAVGVFVVLGAFPIVAAWIGLAATATLALGSIAGMLSAIALLIQDRPVAEVFRAVRLQRSPLVTMLTLTLIMVSLFGGQSSIHDVDRGAPSSSEADDRQTMAAAFASWLASPEPCEVQVGDHQVRPMLLIAAEGGGIRAAYWTVRGLQAIDDKTCGERSTLFSTGASGGSVGLTVARFSGTPDRPNTAGAVDAVKQMAAPQILSRAADGTFVRDVVYGATGVPVQHYAEPDPFSWKDRARLIEDGWADAQGAGAEDWGDRDFLTPSDQLSPTTGELILNSSEVKDACRVWVSQVSPGAPVTDTSTPSFDPELTCDKSPGPGARTIDLFSAYGPFVPGATAESCLGRIRSATAALLTARFPYVTPSAVLGPCPEVAVQDGKATPYWPRTQLVDGGYIENSGLATITDLSDDWLSLVRNHNAEALAAGSTEPLVVPIVVFLTNGDRRVVQPAIDSSPTSELTVPLVTFLRGKSSLGGNDALLERARASVELAAFCPATDGACTDLQNHFPSRVVVVDRVTQPEIGAPLGWVMSAASITSMDSAMTTGQLETTCVANTPSSSGSQYTVQADQETEPSCRVGYATLGDLVRYYNTPG